MAAPVSNVLLVEGDEDKRVIPHLIEANGIKWGEKNEPKIAQIEPYNGVENLIKPGEIETQLKRSKLRSLGILADANGDVQARWHQIRARCTGGFPNLPDRLPPAGLLATNASGLRLGVWLMPDNQSCGMLETFLSFLRPAGCDGLWEHACTSHQEARKLGAGCTEAHTHKAQIHTWLAWQDPPGRQLHQAIIEKILDPRSPYAAMFVQWFRALYIEET